MKFNNKYISDLTSKDRNVALKAARHIVDTPDLEAWNCLAESADNIFDFIKQNINQHFSQVINENNYLNLFKFFNIYLFDFDETFIQCLIKFSDNNLSLKMLDLLKNGSDNEKSYAAKYFSIIPNEQAVKYLFEAYENDFEPLKYNVAVALASANDNVSYNYYLDKLNEDDDWVIIDASQFLQWYGNKNAIEPLLLAMDKSTMPEHVAGSVALLDNISQYFESDNKNLQKLSLDCYQYIIDSLAEIWPLSNIIDFELFDCVEKLITLINSGNDNSRFAALLLKTKYQFEIFYNNDEYKFNEDKNTIETMEGILELFTEGGKVFWDNCIKLLNNELNKEDKKSMIFAINLIGSLSLKEYSAKLKDMLLQDFDDEIIFEIVSALNSLEDFNGVDKNTVLSKVQDLNIKSVIDKMFI